MFIDSLKKGYNLDQKLAKSLASSAIDVLSNGRTNTEGKPYIDLNDLNKHNIIEQ